MGSGGPRGLQIPRSGADRVRGGFDSHAFPPQVLLTLALLLLSGARPVDAAPADTLATIGVAAPDSIARRQPLQPGGWTEQPRVVMLRSLLLPGWGQFHNRAYFKSALVAGTEGWFGVLLVRDRRDLGRLLEAVDRARAQGEPVGYELARNRYNARLDTYVSRQWLFSAVLAYALVDAYVDAHFRDFELEFRMDPALPDGAPLDLGPRAPARKGGVAPARIALRWDF